MKPVELTRELAKGSVRPAYLLKGSEPLLREEALAAIRANVLDAGSEDFNYQRLEGAKTTPANLRDALQALPVMAARRLVVLRDPEPTRGAGRELPGLLPELLAELAEQRETVLVVDAEKVDGRSRWVKAFREPAVVVDCDPPKGRKALVAFIEGEARQQQAPLGPGVAELLADQVGPQLLMLRQEIAKAALLAGPGNEVGLGHAQALVSQTAEQPIWDLTDAIGEGRRASAVELLNRMQRAGAPSPVLLGSLASHFRKLARVNGGGAVAGPPFLVRKLEQQARRYSAIRLRGCMEAIHQTDLAIKGAGALSPELALERLVLVLAG